MEGESHHGKGVILCKDRKGEASQDSLTNTDLLQTEDIKGSNNGHTGRGRINKLVRNFGF